MRIIHIIPNLKKGGAERLVLNICATLQKLKEIKVLLITFSEENEYPLQTKDINWKVVKVKFNLSILKNNVIDIVELQETIEEFQPNIIHSHLFEAELISRSCYYPQAKWFTHCHDNMSQFSSKGKYFKEIVVKKFEKKFLFDQYQKNGGTHFIAISKHTKRYYRGKVKSYPITLMRNAIIYNQFHQKIDHNPDFNFINLISIGSVKPLKNHQFLIELAKELKSQNIFFNLKILGEGESRISLENLVINYELQNQVQFLGNVDNVEEYLAHAHIYLHSSKSEALGLTLIEAMAAGLPVITLDGGGNKDLIIEGKNGFLIPTENIQGFIDKILFFKNNPIDYIKISTFAQEFAKKFDITKYSNKLLALYQKT